MNATLEVQKRGTHDNPALLIALRNTGDRPIKVDRELVFLTYVTATTADGTVIPFEEDASVDVTRPAPQSLKDRFVSLLPGEAISRLIELRGGFKVFQCGIGFGGEQGTAVSSYEAFARLPADTTPDTMIVTYKVGYGFREGFRQYAGFDSASLDLFEGPLEQRVDCQGW